MPLTSMVLLWLVFTLVLYDLEDFIRAGLVLPQFLAHGVASFLLPEPVAAPIVLSGVAHGGIPANGRVLVAVQVFV